MTYIKVDNLTYGALLNFVGRAYTPNLQGGKVRAISASAKASYLPHGEDGGGPQIDILYRDTPLVVLTPDVLEVRNLAKQHSVPALKLVNRVLEQNAPGHLLTLDPKHAAMHYDGKPIEPDFLSGEYFLDEDYGHFYKINGRTVPNYTKEEN